MYIVYIFWFASKVKSESYIISLGAHHTDVERRQLDYRPTNPGHSPGVGH